MSKLIFLYVILGWWLQVVAALQMARCERCEHKSQPGFIVSNKSQLIPVAKPNWLYHVYPVSRETPVCGGAGRGGQTR